MSDNGKRGNYGSTDKTAPTESDIGNGSPENNADLIFCFNDIKIPFPNDCYMQQIREQAGVTNGPVMVNYQYARSRRR